MLPSELVDQLEMCRYKSLDVAYDIGEVKRLFQKTVLGQQAQHIFVTGSIDNRVVIIISEQNLLISLNKPLSNYPRNSIFDALHVYRSFGEFIYQIKIPEQQIYQLIHPQVRLISLSSPDNFPLPRFPLGISDIAEAIRSNWYGEVFLMDMQLGKSTQEILELLRRHVCDIVGFSVTFGQQSILEILLEMIFTSFEYTPLIIVGGSLAALNYQILLERYPSIIVALGEGELTMIDIIQYWHGLKKIENINHIAYKSTDSNIVRTRMNQWKLEYFYVPALDLLDDTLKANGVIQLETSRGCTNACSFCPRSHKGGWRCKPPSFFDPIITYVGRIYDNNPKIARKLFLVDEEFIGHNEKTNIERAMKIAEILHKHRFNFEISSRIDQVYRLDQDKSWHIDRMKFWKYIVEKGLEKVLFGVESGVKNILERFNKKTTREQNIYAIRILSACNIPVRYTYITFDPLMTIEELIETYKFQGRKDLLLRSLPNFSEADLYELVRNEQEINLFELGIPFYRKIPYMLVSLEVFLSSPYLKMAKSQSILGRKRVHSMGKQEVYYLNPQIGLLSHFSQLWIDRNFALDYTLKSIVKIANKNEREPIYKLRTIIKDYSYILLGKMLFIITGDQKILNSFFVDIDEKKYLDLLKIKWDSVISNNNYKSILFDLLDHQISRLMEEFQHLFVQNQDRIKIEHNALLEDAIHKWQEKNTWKLINNTESLLLD